MAGFGAGDTVDILWDGRSIVKVAIDPATGFGSASFRVPAATKGNHSVSAHRGGTVIGPKLFEVVPRIKIIPGMADWGEPVKVSLRGYAPRTNVRIRWFDGSTWIEVARITTSSTGSASLSVLVPRWAPAGANSVRGDAVAIVGGRAQTNAFRADSLIYAADLAGAGGRSAQSPPTASQTPTTSPSTEPTPISTPTAQPPSVGTPIAGNTG